MKIILLALALALAGCGVYTGKNADVLDRMAIRDMAFHSAPGDW